MTPSPELRTSFIPSHSGLSIFSRFITSSRDPEQDLLLPFLCLHPSSPASPPLSSANNAPPSTPIQLHTQLLLLPWISCTGFSPPIFAVGNFQYMEELSSYEAMCRIDSEIQTFDASLQQCTSHVISNVVINIKLHSLSIDTLKEVIGSLLDMNHDGVRIIIECKKEPTSD